MWSILRLLATMWAAALENKLISLRILVQSFTFSSRERTFSYFFPSISLLPRRGSCSTPRTATLEWAVVHDCPGTIMLEISLDTRHLLSFLFSCWLVLLVLLEVPQVIFLPKECHSVVSSRIGLWIYFLSFGLDNNNHQLLNFCLSQALFTLLNPDCCQSSQQPCEVGIIIPILLKSIEKIK